MTKCDLPGCTMCDETTEEYLARKGWDETAAACSLCGGPLVELGALGNRMHYRCWNCGTDCSFEVKP